MGKRKRVKKRRPQGTGNGTDRQLMLEEARQQQLKWIANTPRLKDADLHQLMIFELNLVPY